MLTDLYFLLIFLNLDGDVVSYFANLFSSVSVLSLDINTNFSLFNSHSFESNISKSHEYFLEATFLHLTLVLIMNLVPNPILLSTFV